MKYFDEMLDKHGFGDGEQEPPDAWASREVYVTVLNALARKEGSAVTVKAYDRPGMHNGCMLVFVGKPEDTNSCDPDAAMRRALSKADSLDLDNLVVTKSRIDKKSLAFILAGIGDGSLPKQKPADAAYP